MVGLYKAKLGFKFKEYPPFELTRAVMSKWKASPIKP